MCVHKYFIFKQCGHSYFASTPLIPCTSRAFRDEARYTTVKKSSRSRCKAEPTQALKPEKCTPTAHPYRTLLIHTGLCLDCEVRRARGLALAESKIQLTTYPEQKWRVRYTVPAKSGLEVAFPEGGWAQGSDLDVNGFVRREEEAKRRKEANLTRLVEGQKETGSPASATSWKTSHRHVDSRDGRMTRRVKDSGI